MKPTIVFTDLSNRMCYYQWFIYGFLLLRKKGVIDIKYQLPLFQRLFMSDFLFFFARIWRKVRKEQKDEDKLRALFCGYIELGNVRKTFCIDSADSPFLFYGKFLKEVDCYFKMQCPKKISENGFKLGDVTIPWVDYEYENACDLYKAKARRKLCSEVCLHRDKIKPLLVAIRTMGKNCSFNTLDTRYKQLLSSREIEQTKKAMCYFGTDKGPVPTEVLSEVDFDWESDVMAKFSGVISHPNEKRAIIAKYLQELGEQYDSRLINVFDPSTGKEICNDSLIITLTDFSQHVARFQYNINVSGYRMSIPNRFMDSFICGTAIATDNLHVKWYVPFEKEVVEFGEMGYLRDEQINYDLIKKKIVELPEVNREDVIEQYEQYWAPDRCAEYIINTVLNQDTI